MATVILVRHGRTEANATGILAGRTAGIGLDELGIEQARATAQRLAVAPLAGVISSPLQRCRETSDLIVSQQPKAPPLSIDDRISECDYGSWQGRSLAELAGEDLWSTVQKQPSAALFPGGESLPSMQARAVQAIREHDAAFEAASGSGAVWAAVSHGDLIKAIVADAAGMHLDLFQRIGVRPASISIVQYAKDRPTLIELNSTDGDLSWLAQDLDPGADATVGGGSGPADVPVPTPAGP